MRRKIWSIIVTTFLLILMAFCTQQAFCSAYTGPSIEWGIRSADGQRLGSMAKANDGGYVVAGFGYNGVNSSDALLGKVDSKGNVQWYRFYGGAGYDFAGSVIQTSDGGYAFVGSTTSFGAGGEDIWLVKTDSAGNQLWYKTYGGVNDDLPSSLVQTSDGGYAIGGFVNSTGASDDDFCLIKTDSIGNQLWNRTYGGIGQDYLRCIIQTSDGGYMLVGNTNSTGNGAILSWLVKTDSSGNELWNQTYGTNYFSAIIQSADGGYVLAGVTFFNDTLDDGYLVKIDELGNQQWNQTYGGKGYDFFECLVKTDDGGYTMAGGSSASSPSLGYLGPYDFWLVKTNSTGYQQWSQIYGSPDDDVAYSMVQADDGGYVLIGIARTITDATFSTSIYYTLIIKVSAYAIWTPSVSDAVLSTASALAVIGVFSAVSASVSSGSSAMTSTTSIWDRILGNIRDAIPYTVRKKMEKLLETVGNVSLKANEGSVFRITKGEVFAYVLFVLLFTLAFSYVKAYDLMSMLIVMPTVFFTSVALAIAKKYSTIALTRHKGVWCEHKVWPVGLAFLIFSTFVFKVPISSPTKNAKASNIPNRLSALTGAFEVLITLAFAGIFLALLLFGFTLVGATGLSLCVLGAFFDSFPFSPVCGNQVFIESKKAWLGLFVLALAVYVSWLVFA